ncbi:MAG: YesL family protein [Huintestinicola sp.]
MKFFSIDSPLYKFMQRLWDVIKLNFMWLLFSIPVVTIGCSTIAAFSVALHMTDDTEGDIIRDFFKAFKANIKQGILMTFITLISVYAVYLDFQLYNAPENGSLPFLIIGIFTAYLLTFSLLYVYPLLARYENSIGNSLKNSFRLGMKFFGRTILLVLLLAVEFVLIFWNLTTMFVGLLIGPACVIYTISGTALYIFKETEKENNSDK